MMDMNLQIQGYYRQLEKLENIRDATLGDRVEACSLCYEPSDECVCEDPVLWPIELVIIYLRHILQ